MISVWVEFGKKFFSRFSVGQVSTARDRWASLSLDERCKSFFAPSFLLSSRFAPPWTDETCHALVLVRWDKLAILENLELHPAPDLHARRVNRCSYLRCLKLTQVKSAPEARFECASLGWKFGPSKVHPLGPVDQASKVQCVALGFSAAFAGPSPAVSNACSLIRSAQWTFFLHFFYIHCLLIQFLLSCLQLHLSSPLACSVLLFLHNSCFLIFNRANRFSFCTGLALCADCCMHASVTL